MVKTLAIDLLRVYLKSLFTLILEIFWTEVPETLVNLMFWSSS
jgi:hypothetical protein